MWSIRPTVANPAQQQTYEFVSGLGESDCDLIDVAYLNVKTACVNAYRAYDG